MQVAALPYVNKHNLEWLSPQENEYIIYGKPFEKWVSKSEILLSCSIVHGNVTDLRKKKIYLAPLYIELAGAFLSIQASSAVAERFFGDSVR